MKYTKCLAAAVAATVTALAAQVSLAEGERIAFFAASSQNGFNQAIYEGVEARAKEMGAETAIYDGQFNAELQYNQIEDVLAGGEFDGFVIAPNDPIGVAGAVEQVTSAGFPMATTLFPIGPELDSLEPQVEGLTSTVVSPPSPGAISQAEYVAENCADIDPCHVVIIIGFKTSPFDNLRLQRYLEVFEQHSNIKVVAEAEGFYSPDDSLTAMTDILQANDQVDAVISVGDQHLIGAEIALEAAGFDVPSLIMVGGGAASISIEAIREGRWDATLGYFPWSMGYLATEAIITKQRGGEAMVSINMDEFGPLPPMVTMEVLEEYPDFNGEWAQ